MKEESKTNEDDRTKEELLEEIQVLQKKLKELEESAKDKFQLLKKISNEYVLFRNLIDNITDSIYFKDLDSKFIIINKEQARRFKIDNPEHAIGKTDYDFFTDEHAIQAFHDEQEIIKTEKPMVSFMEKETWENGDITWVSTTKMPLKNNEGDVVGTFGISRDVTKLKKTQTELTERAKDLARSNAELEQFAFVASHDLQEPLRMINCYSKLLEKRYQDALDNDAKEFIKYIVDGAERMRQLINDLLIFSRVNKNVKPFTLVDCKKVLNIALKDLELCIIDAHAKISYDTMPEIVGDMSQLIQLFQNLINNAIKFTKKIPEIHISVSENSEEWIFSVKDNGIGIEKKHADKIFNIFGRLHTREEYCGSGIGLSICKKIVERHQGRIWIDSIIDQGSIFYFSISKHLTRNM